MGQYQKVIDGNLRYLITAIVYPFSCQVARVLPEFKYLLSPISTYVVPEWGVAIKLIDYEHRDYIEDVLAEHFDLETPFSSDADITHEYVLYFDEKITIDVANAAIKVINEYHASNKDLYETKQRAT